MTTAESTMTGMEATDMEAVEKERKARRWFLTWILGFFFVFASVDAMFVYIAMQTHTGEVSSDKGEWAKSKPVFSKAGDGSADDQATAAKAGDSTTP